MVNAVKWFLAKGRVLKKMGLKGRSKFYTTLCFLHGIEVLVLLGVLGYFAWDAFYFVLLGFVLHLILDYVNEIKRGGRFDKVSIIFDYFKYKKLRFIEEVR